MNRFAILDTIQDGEETGVTTEHNESEMTGITENVAQTSNEGRNENDEIELGRPQKRNREVDQDEIWTTMVRKAKVYGREENGISTVTPEFKIEVSVTCTEKLPKQFGLAKMLKTENIKKVVKIKYVNSYKALIHFSDEESADMFLECKTFNENGFKCQRTLDINQSYGVIKDIDLDLNDEEILQGLSCETTILSVKRLKRKNTNDGHWELSESVRICFKGSSLPLHVYIYDTRVNVSPYIYPVTQCSRCWRFGHAIRMCPSLKVVCPKCTKSHVNCETTHFKCNNCRGKHMAMTKICPVYLKEKRIRELMAEFNCSYKKALVIYVPPSPKLIDASEDPPLHNPTAASRTEPLFSTPQHSNTTNNYSTTYANITRKVPRKSKKTEKGRDQKLPSKEREDDIMFECASESSVEDSRMEDNRMEDQLKDECKSKNKEQMSWKLLFTKLKEKILEEGNWEDKIKGCGNIVLEALLSFVMQFIVDQPCCNFIKQLWITTTHSL